MCDIIDTQQFVVITMISEAANKTLAPAYSLTDRAVQLVEFRLEERASMAEGACVDKDFFLSLSLSRLVSEISNR